MSTTFLDERSSLDAEQILKDVCNICIQLENSEFHEPWEISKYSDPNRKGSIRFHKGKNIYATYKCCGARVPHTHVFAPSSYLVNLRLARALIETAKKHCELHEDEEHIRRAALLDEENKKVGRHYPNDIINEMGNVLFQDSFAEIDYPVGKTKLRAVFRSNKSEDRKPIRRHAYDCSLTQHTEIKVRVPGSMNKAYRDLAKKILRLIDAERKCEFIERPEKDLYDRKRADWKERIEMLPETDLPSPSQE